MSSAGNGASLFGDRRSVLIIDLSEGRAERQCNRKVLSIFDLDVEGSKSAYRSLLRILRPYHSPPEVTGNFAPFGQD